MANNTVGNNTAPKQKKLLLAKLFTDAPVRVEPEEPQKVLVAGLAEARPKKDYPDTFFGRAFKVLRGEFGLLIKSSLFFMLFTVPFIVIVAWLAGSGFFQKLVLGESFNFMSNVGTGLSGMIGGGDSVSGVVSRLYMEVKAPIFAMVAASLVFATLGASGMFYCAKRSYFQDYYSRFVKTYWMGFAKLWWKFLLTALVEAIIGLGMAVSMLYFLQQQALGTAGAGAYCAVIFSFVFGAPLLVLPMVTLALFTVYDLPLGKTIKNALVVIVNSPIMVAIVGILSAAPLLLCLINNFFSIVIYIAMLIAGSQLTALCWIAMASRGMTKCHLFKEDADRQRQQEARKANKSAANGSNNGKSAQGKKKQPPKPYQNPKKKKKKK